MKLSRRTASIFGITALAAALLFATTLPAHARVFVSVAIAPPAIPVYAQPAIPGDGYIWTPGYWAWTGDGYEWVDGAWVLPPYVGALWTPGYWGYGPAGYFWNAGYWGPVIGYYGGINYGFGYFGTGFYGGYWHGGHFWYNSCYNHFGYGFRAGHFYNSPVRGWDGHPGGSSWARGGHEGFNGNRGAYVNGHNFAAGNNFNRGGDFNRASGATPSHFGGFGNTARPAYNGGNFNGGAHNFAGSYAPHNFAMPAQGRSMGNFASAQPRGNFGGGSSFHGNAGGFGGGGGFHGGGGGFSGGGGGFHGGGGGGGFHGGGGHR